MTPPGGETGQPHILFSFREPSDSIYSRLEQTLAELRERHTTVSESGHVFDSAVLSRRDCMSKIAAEINKDYSANLRQEPEEPWAFDYVVELSEDLALRVMTRLSAKLRDSMGSVFYGATIVRIGPDSYAIWSDFS